MLLTGADTLITLTSFKDVFITRTAGNYSLWHSNLSFKLTEYPFTSTTLTNYVIERETYPQTQQFLLAEIDNKYTFYLYHHALYSSSNYGYRTGQVIADPGSFLNADYKLNPIPAQRLTINAGH